MDRADVDQRFTAAGWTREDREAFWRLHLMEAAGLTDDEAVALFGFGYRATPRTEVPA